MAQLRRYNLAKLELIARARELYQKFGDIGKVSKLLNTSHTTINPWIADLMAVKNQERLQQRSTIQEQAQQIYRETGSFHQISKQLGITFRLARKLIGLELQKEVQTSKQQSQEEKRKAVRKFFLKSKNITATAAKFGMSQDLVREWVEDLREVQPPDLPWEAAVDELLARGYTKTYLTRLLAPSTPNTINAVFEWFNKRSAPKHPIQQMIIDLSHKLPELPPAQQWVRTKKKVLVVEELPWKEAVTQLEAKGYTRKEIARKIASIINCNPNTPMHWFIGRWRPHLQAQKVILELARELPEKLKLEAYTAALDKLTRMGYSYAELARILCKKVPCKTTTAIHWFGGYKIAPQRLWATFVELSHELQPFRAIPWKEALQKIERITGNKLAASKVIAEHMRIDLQTVRSWFYKGSPSREIQRKIVELSLLI